MNNNKSTEDYSSNINEKDLKNTDIFEQIKNQSDEIKTCSDSSSIKLIGNLSNPTNLTNPQIIKNRKRKYNKDYIKEGNSLNSQILQKIRSNNKFLSKRVLSSETIAKSRSQITINNQNASSFNNNISQIVNNINNIDSLNSHKNKKILKKIEKRTNYKNINLGNLCNALTQRNQRKINNPFYSSRNDLPTSNSVEQKNESILEMIKYSKCILPYTKYTKVDEIKPHKKIDVLKDLYRIKILQNNTKYQKIKYKDLLSKKDLYIKSLDKTIERLKTSKINIVNIYNKNFVLYLAFLRRQLDKENMLNYNLLNEKNAKIFENQKILNKINRLKKEEYELLKWLYLQIQLKEKIIKIPDYYYYILEDKKTLNQINENRNNKITQKEYNRVLEYKGKLLLDYVQFVKIYEAMEEKAIKAFIKNSSSHKNNINVKNELENENENKDIPQLTQEGKNLESKFLFQKLQIIKSRNIELKKQLEKLKISKKKVNVKSPKKNDNKTQSKNISNMTNKLLFYMNSNYNNININVTNNKYYKKDKPLLFKLILLLYELISQNKFKKMDKFDIDQMNYNISDETIMLYILEYSESIVNLLLAEKKYYYSDNILKEKYKKIEEKNEKNMKREKFLIQVKMEEKKNIEKNNKITEKMNKIHFKHYRKIDYDYFRKELNKKKKKSLKNVESETKFEDFFYDLE